MELLVNDLSISGQFPDVPTFKQAIGRIMLMRNLAQQFGRPLHCHRNVLQAQVTQTLSMQQVMSHLTRDESRALGQWFTKQGPSQEALWTHSSDDYLECNGEIVTDSAVGESAFCCHHGIERHLVSLTPSSWEYSPIPVVWKLDETFARDVSVVNYWSVEELEVALREAPNTIESWKQLEVSSRARCPELTFTDDCFEPLRGCPFEAGACQRIVVLLDTLDKVKRCFNDDGERTQEGHRLFGDHFAGGKAWFSDSSATEMHEFRKELTFEHPDSSQDPLFCTWHGKVKSPQLRIHFSWPIRADQPLYVAYIGPKITKR